MKSYISGCDAVSDLHNNGFTNDFQIFGNDLFWVQEKHFIRAAEFAILECHTIAPSENLRDEMVVVGIVAPYHHIKGILIKHYKGGIHYRYPVPDKKPDDLAFQSCIST